jgi:TonB family protein
LALLLAAVTLVARAPAATTEPDFNGRIVAATIQLLPAGLRDKLPTDPAAILAAIQDAAVYTKGGKRDLAEHVVQVKRLLTSPEVTPARLLAELSALTSYYTDRQAIELPRAFWREIDHSPAVGVAQFDGYHCVADFGPWARLVKTVGEPAWKEIEGQGSVGLQSASTEIGDKLTQLFDLYVNANVDLWTTVAQEAGLALGKTAETGARVEPPTESWSGGLLRPTEKLDTAVLTRQHVSRAKEAGCLRDWPAPAQTKAPGEEIVFDEGLSISGADAQKSATQLASSGVTVDSRGVDRLAGLDAEALAALEKLGIDVRSTRAEFKGTRGGVQPGEIVKAGDLEVRLDHISSIEIGERSQKPVYMQLPDSAIGSGTPGGFLNQKVVAAVISANVGGFKTCFERRLRDVPDLAGRVFVQFTINADGAVKEVNLLENTSNDQPFAECIVRQVNRLHFPPPKGGEVSFVFPFIFEQAYSF